MTTLFWRISAQAQALLMRYQYNNYGEKLEIPPPPGTSKGVWLTVQVENSEEIDKLMRQRPKSPKKVK